MSFFDLLFLILENLGRRKARVALTAIGVIIGTTAVVVLVSLAIGLQQNATKNLYGIGDLTQIQVMPNYGSGPVGPGGPVIVKEIGTGSQVKPANQKLITTNSLAELAALPGVAAVIPRDYLMGESHISYNRLEAYGNVIGIGISDLSGMGLEAQAGTLKLEKGTAIIGAYVTKNFFDPKARPGQKPPDPPDLMGQQVKLTLIKYEQDGTNPQPLQIRKTYPIRVTGVIKAGNESDYSIFMLLDDVNSYNEWFTGRRINRQRDGYNQVVVKAESVDKVIDLTKQINDLGYQAFTPQTTVQGINNFYTVLQVIFGGVGAIALLVAAIGIANTMAMAILERTREIGLMKAVGATNRDVLSVFLGEAAGIGFVGGLGGAILGWSAGQVLNVLAVAYLAGQAASQGGPTTSIAAYTPLWLPFFALAFATLVGLLSGLYPALRAATLVPVNALKYE